MIVDDEILALWAGLDFGVARVVLGLVRRLDVAEDVVCEASGGVSKGERASVWDIYGLGVGGCVDFLRREEGAWQELGALEGVDGGGDEAGDGYDSERD